MDEATLASVKKEALNASSTLIAQAMGSNDPEVQHAMLTHTSIYVLAQNILAIAEGEAYAECVLVEAMEVKDLIMGACYELQKKMKSGELKRVKPKKGDTNVTK